MTIVLVDCPHAKAVTHNKFNFQLYYQLVRGARSSERSWLCMNLTFSTEKERWGRLQGSKWGWGGWRSEMFVPAGQWVHCGLNSSSSACVDRVMITGRMEQEQREEEKPQRWRSVNQTPPLTFENKASCILYMQTWDQCVASKRDAQSDLCSSNLWPFLWPFFLFLHDFNL